MSCRSGRPAFCSWHLHTRTRHFCSPGSAAADPPPAPAAAPPGRAPDASSPPHSLSNSTALQRQSSRRVWLSSCRSLVARIDGASHPYLKVSYGDGFLRCVALAVAYASMQVMLTVLLEVADPALVHQPWGATASPALQGRGSSSTAQRPKPPHSSPPGSPTKRFQRNPHQLDTLTSGSGAQWSIPDLSLGESALGERPPAGPPSSPLSNPLAEKKPQPSDASGSHIIQITLHDRVAFASRFLSDDAFVEFIVRIRRECLEGGRVDGLITTGPSPMGAWLLQRYLDNTGDVQTAAIAGCFFLRAVQVRQMLTA